MSVDEARASESDVYEMEAGATSGRSHEAVLEQTLGHERALRNVTAGGPVQRPLPDRRREKRV